MKKSKLEVNQIENGDYELILTIFLADGAIGKDIVIKRKLSEIDIPQHQKEEFKKRIQNGEFRK